MRLALLFCFLTLPGFAQSFTRSIAYKGAAVPPLSVGTPAIVFRQVGSNSTTTGNLNYSTTTSNTISANSLALVCVVSSLASAADPTNVSGNGLTWVKVTSTNYNSGGQRISLWRSLTNATTFSHVITAQFAANQTGCNLWACEFQNTDTTGSNGSGAVVQFGLATNNTANPSITLGAFNVNGKNAGAAFFANVANGFSGTPKANWVEDVDQGYNSPATGQYAEHRLATTDNAPSVTVGAQQWAGIALEVKSQ